MSRWCWCKSTFKSYILQKFARWQSIFNIKNIGRLFDQQMKGSTTDFKAKQKSSSFILYLEFICEKCSHLFSGDCGWPNVHHQLLQTILICLNLLRACQRGRQCPPTNTANSPKSFKLKRSLDSIMATPIEARTNELELWRTKTRKTTQCWLYSEIRVNYAVAFLIYTFGSTVLLHRVTDGHCQPW